MRDRGNVIALRALADREPIVVQPCWTVPELAAYLQVSRRTITAWIRQGRLRAHRLSATVTVIEPAEVERFLAAHETGPGR
jgi:excisionase family DNA binding protein